MALATGILRELAAQGVRDYVVCAGARNAPFVKLLGVATGARVHYFFEERAAGFFALGRARREQTPVAVITTSGTAVAELLPAAVEAHYSGVPLVLITADRPKAFRNTGAPQSIEQVGIFSHYAQASYDFDGETLAQASTWRVAKSAPVQLNVCFTEPLIDGAVEVLDLSPAEVRESSRGEKAPATTEAQEARGAGADRARAFLARVRKPLVILGALPETARAGVCEVLTQIQAPVYGEAHSGLRELERLQGLRLNCIERFTAPAEFRRHFDGLIRIGSVPTLRTWRDLEDTLLDIPVLSVSDNAFSGLARDHQAPLSFHEFLTQSRGYRADTDADIFAHDEKALERLDILLNQYPNAEPAFLRWLSEKIPAGALIMLGNSLPIREWDLAATLQHKNFTIAGNRGVNGIDGLIATFLGQARAQNENWLILGDLSALYDLNALAFTSAAENAILRVVVINNGGGQIFAPMFKDKNFLNSHHFEFAKWAEMFGWDYLRLDSQKPEGLILKPRPTVLEIRPDNAATQAFAVALKEPLP